MLEDKLFKISLIISATIHSFIFVQMPQFKPAFTKPEHKIEVTYQKAAVLAETAKTTLTHLQSQKPPPPFTQISEKPLLQPVLKEDIFAKKQLEIKKEPLEVSLSKKVNLPMSGIDMPKNPAYINYYQRVREEIRRIAYHYSYSHLDEGMVYLSFVVLANGQLQAVKIIEEKTSANAHLRDLALKSIKNAAPFPAFPPALNHDQLPLNIIISCEVELKDGD